MAKKSDPTSVAKVVELSATSDRSFEDAIKVGVARAHATLRNVTGAWVKEMKVDVEDGKITRYRVNVQITFILD